MKEEILSFKFLPPELEELASISPISFIKYGCCSGPGKCPLLNVLAACCFRWSLLLLLMFLWVWWGINMQGLIQLVLLNECFPWPSTPVLFVFTWCALSWINYNLGINPLWHTHLKDLYIKDHFEKKCWCDLWQFPGSPTELDKEV